VVLVDTSVWIEVMRRDHALALESEVDLDDVVTCLPVVQEVLQGIDREDYFRVAREAMWALPMVESPLGEDVVSDAVELYRRARRAGVTIRSSVDCLIAACAMRHDLTVLHVDRDFAQLARISHLSERRIVPPSARRRTKRA
jgi:predicted nucleic acid-binding protein